MQGQFKCTSSSHHACLIAQSLKLTQMQPSHGDNVGVHPSLQDRVACLLSAPNPPRHYPSFQLHSGLASEGHVIMYRVASTTIVVHACISLAAIQDVLLCGKLAIDKLALAIHIFLAAAFISVALATIHPGHERWHPATPCHALARPHVPMFVLDGPALGHQRP